MGSLSAAPGGAPSLAVTTPKLDRIMRQEKIVGTDDTASQRFQQIWQRSMEAIENAFASLTTQVNDNASLLAQIRAAQNLAQAANDNAVAVQQQVGLANSYTDPVGVLSADNGGTVTITAHERVYGDGTRVSVGGGSVTGFAPGDAVTVYYSDAGREGGAVTYQGTTNAVAQEGITHIAGQVTIPAAGEPPAEGSGPTAPGYTPSDKTLSDVVYL